MEPAKINPCKDGGPNGYQTKLGWCIAGSTQNVGHQNSLKCSRVAVKDASTGKLARDHFLTDNVDKDMSTKQMFERINCNDFNERETQIGQVDGNNEQL